MLGDKNDRFGVRMVLGVAIVVIAVSLYRTGTHAVNNPDDVILTLFGLMFVVVVYAIGYTVDRLVLQ